MVRGKCNASALGGQIIELGVMVWPLAQICVFISPRCVKASGCPRPKESAERKQNMNNLLDNAPASYEGALMRFNKGEYTYICTRNNNFTNRSQKAKITVR